MNKQHFFKVSEEQLTEFNQEQQRARFSVKPQLVKVYLRCEICGATEETENCSRTITQTVEDKKC